jgi:hypothetical protein
MNHHEQSIGYVVADDLVAKLIVSAGIGDAQKWIEKCFGCALECDAVVQTRILASLATVPDERDAIEFM